MIHFFRLLPTLLLLCTFTSNAQTNFDKQLSTANPVKKDDTISIKEKTAIHQAYLLKAIEAKKPEQQFYGHLYLWADYLGQNDYEGATHQLFSADSLAQLSGNASWQAAAHGRRGILAFELNDAESALNNFMLTLEYCRETKDSACVAANLKEVALCYQRLQKYDSAKHYFELAIPLIRKYTDSFKLYAYYSNYSNLLNDMGDYHGAKRYLDSSLIIVMKGKDLFMQSVTKNNLAAFYVKTGEYDKALKILEECIAINKQHGWFEQLSFNYANKSEVLSKKGDYRSAYGYLQNYYSIDDSLKGDAVKIKIGKLNAKYESQSKEIELEKQQIKLLTAEHSLEIREWAVALSLLIILFGLWLWWSQKKKAKQEQLQSKKDLAELTRILIDKNSLLAALEEKVSTAAFAAIAAANLLAEETTAATEKPDEAVVIEEEKVIENDEQEKSGEANDFEKNIYSQRILTPADWSAFKIYFEKAFPGYLLRLRNAHPSITEAEERMFLFIKLKLTNKEAAAILGISADSVKKTRTRLRKRLVMDEKTDLDEFVREF